MTKFVFEIVILHQNHNDNKWYTTTHFRCINASGYYKAFYDALDWGVDLADLYLNGEVKSITRM